MKSVVTPLEQPVGREPDMVQALSAIVPGEEVSGAACTSMDLAMTSKLFRERGYGMLCRFGHVHATREAQEWHVCMLADLFSMPPSRLLACLDEALALRVEQSMALFPQT